MGVLVKLEQIYFYSFKNIFFYYLLALSLPQKVSATGPINRQRSSVMNVEGPHLLRSVSVQTRRFTKLTSSNYVYAICICQVHTRLSADGTVGVDLDAAAFQGHLCCDVAQQSRKKVPLALIHIECFRKLIPTSSFWSMKSFCGVFPAVPQLLMLTMLTSAVSLDYTPYTSPKSD